MKKQKICSHCGYQGEPVNHVKGSLGTEIMLWLFFAIPGIIYTVWRLTTRAQRCPVCYVDLPMLPIEAPKAQMLYYKLYPDAPPLVTNKN